SKWTRRGRPDTCRGLRWRCMPSTSPMAVAPPRSPSDQGDGTSAFTPHATPAVAVLQHFGTDDARGLDPASVVRARSRSGYDELAEAPAPPWWKRLAGQFKQLVIWILVAAAAISGVLGDWV